jgi:hypothetical protein
VAPPRAIVAGVWTSWLQGFDDSVEIRLADPVDDLVLTRAELQLGLALPHDLRSLLAETDGITDASDVELVWAAERIAEENLGLRRDHETPAVPRGGGDLLFFGDTGTADLFAYRITADGAVCEPDVYLWKYQPGTARWVASDLQSLLDAWFSRELEL